jgi:hypothetical protein
MTMKNLYLLIAACSIVLSMLISIRLVSFSTGAPTNASGSPGNNGLTCVQCHPSNNNDRIGWISSTELANGYVAGNYYNMRAKAERAGSAKFGFLITIEKEDGTKAGAPVVTDVAKTQLSNTYYLTHTQAGTAGVDSAVWLFKWAAPAAPIGTVALYGAFVGADGNNQNSGDMVFISKKTVILYGTQGIGQAGPITGTILHTYPNPASSIVNLTLDNAVRNAQFSIFAPNGSLVKRVVWELADVMTLDVSSVPEGSYMTRLEWDHDCIVGKLLVRR